MLSWDPVVGDAALGSLKLEAQYEYTGNFLDVQKSVGNSQVAWPAHNFSARIKIDSGFSLDAGYVATAMIYVRSYPKTAGYGFAYQDVPLLATTEWQTVSCSLSDPNGQFDLNNLISYGIRIRLESATAEAWAPSNAVLHIDNFVAD